MWRVAFAALVSCTTTTEAGRPHTAGSEGSSSESDVAERRHSCSLPVDPVQLVYARVYAQFRVAAGQVVPGDESVLQLDLGPADWAFTDPTDDRYCSILAELSTEASAAVPDPTLLPPVASVAADARVSTDCPGEFELDPRLDVTRLFTQVPGWSVGIARQLDPAMDLTVVPPGYLEAALGAWFQVPVLDPARTPTALAFAFTPEYVALPATEIWGHEVLPDGVYGVLGPMVDVEALVGQ